VELGIGSSIESGRLLPFTDPAIQDEYLAAAREQKMVVSSLALNIFHKNPLKSDRLAPGFLDQGIAVAGRMKVPVLLVPFFGIAALENRAEMDRTAAILKEHSSTAERAGVSLGVENGVSAEDNARILDQVGSKAVKVFYDVGNAISMGGFDAPKEIRWLGKERICHIHLKDVQGRLGEGKVNFREVFRAMRAIDFEAFTGIETVGPTGKREVDIKNNADFVRRVAGEVYAE
jgi:L-ribulose-5-phosphate 3-epimerase